MKNTLIAFVVAIAAIIGVYALATGNMLFERRAAPYREETRKQTYDTSRTYQQGTQMNIANWCLEMRTKPEHAKAVAAMIRDAAATYSGPLSSENITCIAEAKGN